MKIQKHFVAYFDILGFKQYVKDNLQTPEKPLELLQQFIEKTKMFNFADKLTITAFSDNIVVSMLADEPIPQSNYDRDYWIFITYINYIQIYMITCVGILPIRGGITFGDLYHNKSEVLFGEALVDAYNLENSHAFYPRIVVSPTRLDPNNYIMATEKLARLGLAKNFHENNSDQSVRQYPVAYDYDGILFCNYLSSLYLSVSKEWAEYTHSALGKHKSFVERNLAGTNDMNILRKYTWMKSYHNWFCEPFEEFLEYIIKDR